MFKKLLFATVLVAFVCVKLGVALDCFACSSQESCAQTRLPEITCTVDNAYDTSKAISQYYQRVLNTTSENFLCLTMNLTQGVNSNSIFQKKGCVFKEINACSLQVKNTVEAPFTSLCRQCNSNLCNGNPAGSFSSSVFTMFASAVGVALAKRFIF